MKKWYESDEESTQPLVVALPSQPRIAPVSDAFRRALIDEINAAHWALNTEPR